ncbi:hypothetical protein [Enemella sp. A6]|uniref:hypothetical protein n=1 Tax=Enemella sp. A6 TaxID=3440152 RepID=UPI003EBAD6ED
MPRRVALPGENKLLHATDETATESGAPPETAAERRVRRGSGRVRHDEKITVYISKDELLALETARLTLRGHGLAVDRGRIVREAVAMALEDLDERADDSEIVQRLQR